MNPDSAQVEPRDGGVDRADGAGEDRAVLEALVGGLLVYLAQQFHLHWVKLKRTKSFIRWWIAKARSEMLQMREMEEEESRTGMFVHNVVARPQAAGVASGQ